MRQTFFAFASLSSRHSRVIQKPQICFALNHCKFEGFFIRSIPSWSSRLYLKSEGLVLSLLSPVIYELVYYARSLHNYCRKGCWSSSEWRHQQYCLNIVATQCNKSVFDRTHLHMDGTNHHHAVVANDGHRIEPRQPLIWLYSKVEVLKKLIKLPVAM